MYNNKSNDTEKVIAVTIEKIKRIYARFYPEIDSGDAQGDQGKGEEVGEETGAAGIGDTSL